MLAHICVKIKEHPTVSSTCTSHGAPRPSSSSPILTNVPSSPCFYVPCEPCIYIRVLYYSSSKLRARAEDMEGICLWRGFQFEIQTCSFKTCQHQLSLHNFNYSSCQEMVYLDRYFQSIRHFLLTRSIELNFKDGHWAKSTWPVWFEWKEFRCLSKEANPWKYKSFIKSFD